MKRMHLLAIAVVILALFSFGCDTGNDDDSATTVFGENPTLSGSLTEITESGEDLGSWEGTTHPVIIAKDAADGNSGVYAGMDQDGDSSLSMELGEPSQLYPVTEAFQGADISDTEAEIFPANFGAFRSLDQYQTQGEDADYKFVGLIDFVEWGGEGEIPSWLYMYADGAVTITGTTLVEDGPAEVPVNLSLQPGWNVVYAPMGDGGKCTEYESTPVSSAAQWVVGQ